MRTIFTHIVVALLFSGVMFGQAFVDKGFHPKSAALGRSVVAMTKDASLLYYNPAAIGFETSANVFAGYTNLYPSIEGDNMNLMVAGGAYSLGSIGVVGIGIQQFSPNFWSEQVFIGTFATRMFGEDLSIGANVKVLRWSADAPQGENAVPEPALTYTGFTFDAGVSYVIPEIAEENDLTVGGSLLNITQPSTASNGSSDAALPMSIHAGAMFHSRKFNYSVMAGTMISDGDIKITFGGELMALRSTLGGVNSEFFVRIGGGRVTAKDSQGEYNGGFGLKMDRFVIDFSYSYQAFVRNVGGISSLSVGYEW
ncbi:MAG: type IX secretion system membrane protein PorP/SprF [Bacteroidota bacterium]